MLSKSDAAKALRTHFKKHLVATLPELVEVLRNPSRSSVYRRLKTLGYLASYTHAGAHYTLSEIPDFDEAGLWWHRLLQVRQFERHHCGMGRAFRRRIHAQ